MRVFRFFRDTDLFLFLLRPPVVKVAFFALGFPKKLSQNVGLALAGVEDVAEAGAAAAGIVD